MECLGNEGILHPNEELRKFNFKLFEAGYGVVPKINENENDLYMMKCARNGEMILFAKGKTESQNLRLTSYYDPKYEAKRWADKYELTNRRTSVVLLGFSTGVYLEALMNKLRPDTTFFVLEPDEGLFAFICGFINLKEVLANKRITLYVTDEQKRNLAADVINEVVSYRAEAFGIITPFYATTQEFQEVCEAARKSAMATNNYQMSDGRKALKCRIYSWNHMVNSMLLSAVRDKMPDDIPAIIVSAGPSLRKNVEILRQIKDTIYQNDIFH